MAPRPIKPHQQEILDAFDAGERNAAELGRRFGFSRYGIARVLERYGRQPRDKREAGRETSIRVKAQHTDPAFKAMVRRKASPWMLSLSASERPWYRKMIRSGVKKLDARDAIDRARAKDATQPISLCAAGFSSLLMAGAGTPEARPLSPASGADNDGNDHRALSHAPILTGA